MLPLPISTVGAWFVSRSLADSCPITNAELQRLCYTAHGIARAAYARHLFSDPIEAWDVGPVVPTLWREYEDCAGSAIAEPRCAPPTEPLSLPAPQVLNEAWDRHRNNPDWSAAADPHREAPWCEARARGDRAVIDDIEIREDFYQRFCEEDGEPTEFTTQEVLDYVASIPGVEERVRQGRADADAGHLEPWE